MTRRTAGLGTLLLLFACSAEGATATPPELNNRHEIVSLLLASDAAPAIRVGAPAEAELVVEVDERGRVAGYRLVRPTGDPVIDAALARLAGTMTFAPSTRDGLPVRASITIPFAFGDGTVR